MLRTALPAALLLCASPAFAQESHAGHESPPAQEQAAPQPDPHADHNMSEMQGMDPGAMQNMPGMAHMQGADHQMSSMTGALGSYAMNREASGTSWQPDIAEHGGVHVMRGPWMFMGHALFNEIYDWQDGPRGDSKSFLAGMIMGSARRDLNNGDTLNFRAMLSPDPAMGARGYPLLLAAGETADGATTLTDRQHPHDLFMELSASYAHPLGERDSVFVYAGLPGEPAFGPPTFMHRQSAADSPEAPISHHWFDSTHITFGVLTAGYVHGDWKIEASRFRGREPDQHRTDIETGALDSSSARVSWNPNENWSLQASWADIASPEALEPDVDETRVSLTGMYTQRVGEAGWWSTTLGFANKDRSDGVSEDAWLAETALHPNEAWTLFARGERIETDELISGPARAYSRLSLGAIRDWRVNAHAILGIGALAERHFTPSAADSAYGGDPDGAMGFVRLKIG